MTLHLECLAAFFCYMCWPAGTAPEQASADMRAYYDETDESRFGVVAIGIKTLQVLT